MTCFTFEASQAPFPRYVLWLFQWQISRALQSVSLPPNSNNSELAHMSQGVFVALHARMRGFVRGHTTSVEIRGGFRYHACDLLEVEVRCYSTPTNFQQVIW